MADETCRAYPNSLYSRCQCPRHKAQRSRVMKAASTGRLRRVTVEEAWEAIDRMRADGYTVREIAAAAGLNIDSLYGATTERSMTGRARAIQPLARAALVRAEATMGAPRWRPVHGTARRLQALTWMGWPTVVLAEETGLTEAQIQHARSARVDRCLRTTAEAVEAAYDRLWARPGPDERARLYARRKGWHGPLAWDDETIDDPAAEPRGAAA